MRHLKIIEVKWYDGEYFQTINIACYEYRELDGKNIVVNGALIELNGDIQTVIEKEIK